MNQIILEFLNSLAVGYSWLAALAIFCAVYLPYLVVAGLVVVAVFDKERKFWKTAAAALAAAAGSWFLIFLFKEFFPSPRPFEVLTSVTPLFTHSAGGAFPSGHAVFFSALASAVFSLGHRRAGLWLGAAALLIAIARVVAAVHWPIDVLVGLIIGTLGGYISAYLLKSRIG